MDIVGPDGTTWIGVGVATSRRSRWRGLMGRSPRLLLLRTRSVHGFWLLEPIWVVGIDAIGFVTAVRLLKRRRLAWLRRAHWILEMPSHESPPRVGDRLTFRPGDGEPDGHVRPSVSLRHSHRQPR